MKLLWLLTFNVFLLASIGKAQIGQLVPEFAPSQALVLSTGFSFKIKGYVESLQSNQYALENLNFGIDEKFKAFQILVDSLPEVKVIVVTDSSPLNGSSEKNFLLSKFKPSKSTEFQWSVTDSNTRIDEWIRDFGPLGVRTNDGQLILVDLSEEERGKESNVEIASSLEIPILRPPTAWWQGGDLMTNGSGLCFYSEDGSGYSEGLDSICNNVIGIPRLPVEQTGHIDIFAKFVSEDKVIVSQYKSNNFEIASNFIEIIHTCNDEQIENEQWEACSPQKGLMNQPLGVNQDSIREALISCRVTARLTSIALDLACRSTIF